jgi:hypothetical protein
MRVPLLVLVLLSLVVELFGARLAAVDWSLVTPLMVASAAIDALLVVAVLVGLLVAADLMRHRRRHGQARPHAEPRGGRGQSSQDRSDVLGIHSWRPAPAALPLGAPAAAPTATYAEPTYGMSGGPVRVRRPFPEDDGTLL